MSAERPLRRIAEGREAEVFAWEDGAVLKLYRHAEDGRRAEWEAAAMTAAATTGHLVPTPRGLTTVDGRPGLLMERVDGPDLLSQVARRPWTVLAAGRVLGQIHARLHTVAAPEGLPPLRDALRLRITTSPLVPAHLQPFALSVLDSLPDGDIICHGDFHPGNVIMGTAGPAVIDWTNATRGDPAGDFARTTILISIGEPPPGSPLMLRLLALVGRDLLLSAYRRSYSRQRSPDPALVRRWLAAHATARFAENIESEWQSLERIVRREMRQ